MYTLDIEDWAETDVNIEEIRKRVLEELDELQDRLCEDKDHILALNHRVTSALYPKIDVLIREYEARVDSVEPKKRCSRCKRQKGCECPDDAVEELTKELGDRIGELLPLDDCVWFTDRYEFGCHPMLDKYMNDDTLMIMKLYNFCAKCTPHAYAWNEAIPFFRARAVAAMRALSG